MENLLGVYTDSSQHNLKEHLYDVESQIRGLTSLGIPASSYGSLMSSILMTKLPQEFRLLVNHEVKWNLMELINGEIDARERASISNYIPIYRATHKCCPASKWYNSAPKCVYCYQNHSSTSCKTIVDVATQKQTQDSVSIAYIRIT